jgi:hypothetical protein
MIAVVKVTPSDQRDGRHHGLVDGASHPGNPQRVTLVAYARVREETIEVGAAQPGMRLQELLD